MVGDGVRPRQADRDRSRDDWTYLELSLELFELVFQIRIHADRIVVVCGDVAWCRGTRRRGNRQRMKGQAIVSHTRPCTGNKGRLRAGRQLDRLGPSKWWKEGVRAAQCLNPGPSGWSWNAFEWVLLQCGCKLECEITLSWGKPEGSSRPVQHRGRVT